MCPVYDDRMQTNGPATVRDRAATTAHRASVAYIMPPIPPIPPPPIPPMSAKHLHRYADESAFRLSTFELGEGERFDLCISGCEGSLTYDELIGSPEWIR